MSTDKNGIIYTDSFYIEDLERLVSEHFSVVNTDEKKLLSIWEIISYVNEEDKVLSNYGFVAGVISVFNTNAHDIRGVLFFDREQYPETNMKPGHIILLEYTADDRTEKIPIPSSTVEEGLAKALHFLIDRIPASTELSIKGRSGEMADLIRKVFDSGTLDVKSIKELLYSSFDTVPNAVKASICQYFIHETVTKASNPFFSDYRVYIAREPESSKQVIRKEDMVKVAVLVSYADHVTGNQNGTGDQQ
ncbi:MAG: hypothetical protein ACFFD4_39210 [Candidatus Odinarchaeota archaeon]